MPAAALTPSKLFARLAEGHAARVTVVTPNQRLSRSLTLEFDDFQVRKNLSVWQAPEILPFERFGRTRCTPSSARACRFRAGSR